MSSSGRSTPSAAGIGARIERDLLGEKSMPASAYYGIQTARAVENFEISGVPIRRYPHLIRALAMVKLAAARANHDCGKLAPEVFQGIEAACRDLMAGWLHEQFPLDVFQGGAGTSTNMNANEVIANRALEHMGHPRGEYRYCDPHDHVNMSQSTNDVYPSALQVAMMLKNAELLDELGALAASFRARGQALAHIVKIGRTHLQDAVPMTLGQELEAWGRSIEGEGAALAATEDALLEVNMGGTAVGTGLNAPPGYAAACVRHLADITGKPIRLAPDLVAASWDTRAFVLCSSALRSLAIKLSKICNDLRLLASGPRAGLHEINLPAVQAGSSIMPGKVNPVIPEVVNQICYRVIGCDTTVSFAAEAGQLQLNVMEPLMAACILESQLLLANALRTLRERCVDGITANEELLRFYVERSLGIATALNPVLGYDKATELAAEALATGRGVVELLRERALLTDDQIRSLLDPKALASGDPTLGSCE